MEQQAMNRNPRVAIVGLGYVGLSLASAFGGVTRTVGFDIDSVRVQELRDGYDRNGALEPHNIHAPYLELTDDPARLESASIIIVAVPTRLDLHKRPDLTHLVDASRTVAKRLRRGSIVVYESTVYPGVTEEICLPILSKGSGLQAGVDFHVGYSPERLNVGDPEHALDSTVKIVAAQDIETREVLASLYQLIVKAGICRAPDIRSAEAAKLIENIQRDVNIALMNEISVLLNRIGLDTLEVLRVVRTKWNALSFEPGLVGGDCIPVNPHYWMHAAKAAGLRSNLVEQARLTNEKMPRHIVDEVVGLFERLGRQINESRLLVLGLAFKEDIGDSRNSLVPEVVRRLVSIGADVVAYDPFINEQDIDGIRMVTDPFSSRQKYHGVMLAVPHRQFREKPLEQYLGLLERSRSSGVVVDLRRVLSRDAVEAAGVIYWGL